MKRFLNNHRYELDQREKESLWRDIQQQVHRDSSPHRTWLGRRSLVPTVGMTLVTAMVVLAVLWQGGRQGQDSVFGPDQPGRIPPAPVVTDRSGSPVRDADPESGRRTAIVVEEPKAAGQPGETVVLAEAPPLKSSSHAKEGNAPLQLQAAPASRAAKQAVAPASGVTGRVVDSTDGQALPYATVLIKGTTRGVSSDEQGSFVFENLSPGQEITLQVFMLGFAPVDTTVVVAENGLANLSLALDPVVVATLDAFDVEDGQYMVETAISKSAGVVKREGQGYVRGGRRGEVTFHTDGVEVSESGTASVPRRIEEKRPGSVTGGTTPPNDESWELMYFQHTGVNPFVATEDDALSTFALDVDNASYTLTRSYLERGSLPPPDAIRVEEFVNFFASGLPDQTDEDFRIHAVGSPSRFGEGYHLLRIGLQGRSVDTENRKAANLTFVIDISGSMNMENRLGAVKQALTMLLGELAEGDRVGIVVYGSSGRVLLEPTDISRRSIIEAAIAELGPGGSTNAAEGLELAYRLARDIYEPAKINRLILCSDGVANMGGSTSAEGILELVRRSSDEGITLSTVGFGMGNYNDVLMEKLADQGDGNYHYVDDRQEAERVFRENLTGLLQTIAREAKIQVEFDPSQVQRWRLLGYENRDVADEDFRNDDIDAGEVGAGHQVTALYELKLDGVDGKLGTVRLRYEAPAHDTARAGQVTEISRDLRHEDLVSDFARAPIHLRVQAAVAEFAEILRGSYWAKDSTLAQLVPVVDGLAAELPGDEAVQELAQLVRRAADLAAGEQE